MSGLLGSGDLYVNRKVNGVPQGRFLIGNATMFQLTEGSDVKERKSKQRDTYGQVLDVAYIKQPSVVNIALDEVNKDNLALALLGTVATFTEAGGAVVGEAVTTGSLDFWVNLAGDNLTADPITVQDVTDVTTYVAGTDYEIDLRLGMIRPLTGGAISAGDVLHVSYTAGASSGSTISGAVQPSIEAELFLDGRNLADGKLMQVLVPESVMAPTSPVDFLSDDWTSIELDGRAKTPIGSTTPYTVKFFD